MYRTQNVILDKISLARRSRTIRRLIVYLFRESYFEPLSFTLSKFILYHSIMVFRENITQLNIDFIHDFLFFFLCVFRMVHSKRERGPGKENIWVLLS